MQPVTPFDKGPTCCTIASGPHAPATARAVVRRLADGLDACVVDEAVLLTSELVTNCVRHGGTRPGSPIVLDLERRDDVLHVQVTDDGRGYQPLTPQPLPSQHLAVGGWGLVLVDRLARRWGRDLGGRRIWFELATDTAHVRH